MRYLVRLNDLDEKIIAMEKQLDIIDESISNIEKLKVNFKWEGDSKIIFIEKYNQYINRLRNIEKTILECIDFFSEYSSKYSEKCQMLKKKYASLYDEEGLL